MQYDIRRCNTPDLEARQSVYMGLTLDRSRFPGIKNPSSMKPKGDFISFNEFNQLLDSNRIVNSENSRKIPDGVKFPKNFVDNAHRQSVILHEKYLKKAYKLGLANNKRYLINKTTFNKISNYNSNFSEENNIDLKT